MIVRAHRFHGRNSLRYVYQRGATVRSSFVSLKFINNERRDTWRASVVVSRKVSKSAVVRNRIRRRIYEVVRANAPLIKQPYDLLFTVFSDQVAALPADELTGVITDNLKRAKII